MATPNDGGGQGLEPDHSTSMPTAPSPPDRQADPFEVIEDVPSIDSAANDLTDQVSQLDIAKLQIDPPVAMTPPLTPPTIHTKASLGDLIESDKKLLSRLGGYGWRG